MSEGGDAPVETGPLEDRLVSKAWKTRLAAYEELERIFKQADEGDRKLDNYSGFWKGVLGDNNAAAQEKGLDAFVLYLEKAKEAPKTAPVCVPIIVEKCLGGRPNTKTKANNALLMYIEIENAAEPVVTNLVKGGSHKNPKICVASLVALKEIMRVFGPKAFPIKLLLPNLAPFFDNADKNVREEAKALVIEIFRWLGQIVKTQIESLRPAQVKELETAFEELKGQKPPVPERYLRSQQAAALLGPPPGATEKEPEEIDPYELVDAVDVASKIPADFYESVASPKWQVRRDCIEALIGVASAPKLKNADFSELVKALKKVVSGDANVIVVSKAAKLLGLLAKGLRKDFAVHAKSSLGVLLEKMKEKKQNVTDAIHEALDSMYGLAFNLPDIIEDIQATINNKVPKVRNETLLFMTRIFKGADKVAKKQAIIKVVKPLGAYLLSVLDDSDPGVRDAAAVTFGALAGVVGEKPLKPFLEKLDKIKLEKVKANFPEVLPGAIAVAPVSLTAEELGLDNEEKKEKAPAKKGKAPAKTTSSVSEDDDAPPKKEPAKKTSKAPAKKAAEPPAEKAPPKKAPAKGAPAKKGGKADAKKGKEEDLSPILGDEEALARAAEAMSDAVIAQLNSGQWKERLSGVEEVANIVDKLSESGPDVCFAVVKQLQTKPGPKESNFQVMSGMFAAIAKLARVNQQFPKQASAIIIPVAIDKISDAKLKPAVSDLLTALIEASNTQFVFSQVYKATSGHKNPKVIGDALVWIAQSLEDFGLSSVNVKGLIDYSKECFELTNATVRTQAIKTLGVLRKYVGPGLRDFVADVKASLLSTIDEEFNKVADQKPNPPSKEFREAAAVASKSGGGGGAPGELPREDISGQITAALLKQLADANWKTRKEALEEIQGIIFSASKRITPNLGGLMPALKARLGDTNKNLVMVTSDLLGLLASSVGPPIEKSIKTIIPTLLGNFGDNNKGVKEKTALALDMWATETGLEPFLALLPTALTEVPTGRKEILSFMVKFLPTLKGKKPDFPPLIKPLVGCLEDKNSEVRKLAETVLQEVVQHVGVEAIRKQCNDLKPASRLVVDPIVQGLKVHAKQESKAEDPKKNATAPSKQAPPPAKGAAPTKTAATAPAKPSKVEITVLLVANDQKEERSRKLPWALNSYNQNDLAEAMSTLVQTSVHAKLFSPEPKKRLEGLVDLDSGIQDVKAEMKDNLDVLLKYVALQFAEYNEQICTKALEFTTHILSFLDSEGYRMNDDEASFLPFLIEKLGEPSLSKIIRSLLKSPLPKLYPASKLFKFITDGIKSSNEVTKLQAIEETSSFIERHGSDVATNIKQSIAFICDAALNPSNPQSEEVMIAVVKLFAVLLAHLGSEMWKYVPELTRPFLQEKLSGRSTASQRASADAFSLDLDELQITLPSANSDSPDVSSIPNISSISQPTPAPNISQVFVGQPGPSENLVDVILHADMSRVIEELKMVCLLPETDPMFDGNNDLVEALTYKVQTVWPQLDNNNTETVRLVKYLLNTLHKLFTKDQDTGMIYHAKSYNQRAVTKLFKVMIACMLDTRLQGQMSEGLFLQKAVNILAAQLLNNTDKTLILTVLLQIMNSTIPSDLSAMSSSQNEFLTLVMKCLLKLIKSLSTFINELNVDYVLKELHLFLENHPPQKFKHHDDMPLRTIKTAVSEMVSLLGHSIRSHMSLIPQTVPPASITAYIDLLLTGQGPKGQSGNNQYQFDPKSQLTEIFKKISTKETTQQGLLELYKFIKDHPDVDIRPQLQRASPHFQEYIKRGLANIEQQMQRSSDNKENIGTTETTSSYMERLRKLQKQYNLPTSNVAPNSKKEDVDPEPRSYQSSMSRPASFSVSSSSIPTARPSTDSLSSSAPSSSRDSENGGSTTPSLTSTQSVSDLRSRLARIKNSIGPSSNT